jgi:hypothetical protein
MEPSLISFVGVPLKGQFLSCSPGMVQGLFFKHASCRHPSPPPVHEAQPPSKCASREKPELTHAFVTVLYIAVMLQSF